MIFLDENKIQEIINRKEEYLSTDPFPWSNIQDLIFRDKYWQLVSEMPGPRDESEWNYNRINFSINPPDYDSSDIYINNDWLNLLNEFKSDLYLSMVETLTGLHRSRFHLKFQWTYRKEDPIKPHPDVEKKRHVLVCFMFEPDYQSEWKGSTIILKVKNGIDLERQWTEDFSPFQYILYPKTFPNYSVMFNVGYDSYHAGDDILFPENRHRKIFMVIAMTTEEERIRQRVEKWKKKGLSNERIQEKLKEKGLI